MRYLYTEYVDTYSLAPTPPTPSPEGTIPPSPIKKYAKYLLIGGLLLGLMMTFLFGIMIGSAGKKAPPASGPDIIPTRVPTVTPADASQNAGTSIQYLPGKQYYDDSVAIITKKEPFHAVLLSASRFEQTSAYTQITKVNYFDGTAWLRENVATAIPSSNIVTNPLLKNWSLKTTVGGSLQDNTIDITIENKSVSFTLKKMSNDISTTAYQGYSKFNYFGEGVLKTADDEQEAYIFYTQTFSANASDISFLSTPDKLENDWLVFWDNQGNAYHIDKLASDLPNKPLQNYAVGIILYANGHSFKLNRIDVRKNSQATNEYSFSIQTNPQTTLNVLLSQPLNKATTNAYSWQTGILTGKVGDSDSTVNGVGLVEMLHTKK